MGDMTMRFLTSILPILNGVNSASSVSYTHLGKAALTVTADNVTVTYGEPKPEFTAQINGFVNDDYEGDLTGTLEFDCAYAAGSPVGTYPVSYTHLLDGFCPEGRNAEDRC